MLVKLLLIGVLNFIALAEVRYDNYALYKVHPKNDDHVKYLKDLHENANHLDFWMPPSKAGEYVSVVCPPEQRREFEHNLSTRSIYSELMVQNIQDAFDAQLYSRKRRDTSRNLYWTNYQTLEEIYDWFEHLAEEYSSIVTLITAGQSHEGRNITGVRISRKPSNRSFVLQGGQVAADWLSPTVITYIVNQLVLGDDLEARTASEDFVWHIFPIVNPDGHEFTQTSVRGWVKNRRPISNTAVGVDLTKNWNSQWGIIGGSFIPANNNYVGLGPFSEIETRSVSQYIARLSSSLTGFLSFRSFGQRLVIPFAHTTDPMYNYNEMIIIARRAMGSLAVRYNTQYLVGTSGEVVDGATGSEVDWVKYRFNPPIAALYHLRDNGTWGYTLPVSQVQPSCEETFDSLMAIIREAKFINVI